MATGTSITPLSLAERARLAWLEQQAAAAAEQEQYEQERRQRACNALDKALERLDYHHTATVTYNPDLDRPEAELDGLAFTLATGSYTNYGRHVAALIVACSDCRRPTAQSFGLTSLADLGRWQAEMGDCPPLCGECRGE